MNNNYSIKLPKLRKTVYTPAQFVYREARRYVREIDDTLHSRSSIETNMAVSEALQTEKSRDEIMRRARARADQANAPDADLVSVGINGKPFGKFRSVEISEV